MRQAGAVWRARKRERSALATITIQPLRMLGAEQSLHAYYFGSI